MEVFHYHYHYLCRLGDQGHEGVIDRVEIPCIHVPEGIKGSHEISLDNQPSYLQEESREPI
jgi:hypothetical protein